MNRRCVPFPKKALYLVLTLPMIAIYIGLALFLWGVSLTAFIVFCVLFVVVAFAQSYVCVYWQCPYVGRFAPCVGGFCLPSSQLARLWKNARRSEQAYNIIVTVAFAAFAGIILFPVYFLYRLGVGWLLAYLGVVLLYAAGFLGFICPVCATRSVCPGGQAAVKLRKSLLGGNKGEAEN